MMEDDAKKMDRSFGPDTQTTEPLLQLPTVQDFEELLSRDVPLQTTSCEMNYSVYSKYSRSC